MPETAVRPTRREPVAEPMVWDRRRTCSEVGWSYRTWLRIEARGEGPPRFMARGQWWYRPADVREWIAAQVGEPR